MSFIAFFNLFDCHLELKWFDILISVFGFCLLHFLMYFCISFFFSYFLSSQLNFLIYIFSSFIFFLICFSWTSSYFLSCVSNFTIAVFLFFFFSFLNFLHHFFFFPFNLLFLFMYFLNYYIFPLFRPVSLTFASFLKFSSFFLLPAVPGQPLGFLIQLRIVYLSVNLLYKARIHPFRSSRITNILRCLTERRARDWAHCQITLPWQFVSEHF